MVAMELCKHLCLPFSGSDCPFYQHQLLAVLSSRHRQSRLFSVPSWPSSRCRSQFVFAKLALEREGAGILGEENRKGKSFVVADSSRISTRQDASMLDNDDSNDDEDEILDDDTDDTDENFEDIFALEDILSEEEEDKDDVPEDLGREDSGHMDEKMEIRRKVQELCQKRQDNQGYCVNARDLAALYNFSIDKFQRSAIEGFLKGSSVVVCAPTSSGKTLIAECAAAATLTLRKRIFYTTPLKALSNQKFREFRHMFGEENVGLLTGDAAVNRDASILIMTTEILRNMLYQSIGVPEKGEQLHNVVAIVLDEVHYLSDISRGTVWEEVVIYCPKEVQLICLSATVANSNELAGWIGQVHGPTELITSRRRPVPLTWHFSTRYSLSPLLNDAGMEMNRRLSLARFLPDEEDSRGRESGKGYLPRYSSSGQKPGGSKSRRGNKYTDEPPALSNEELQFLRRRQIPRVEETLRQLKFRGMLPAIWFIFSRRGCDTAIRYVQETNLLTEEEQRQVFEALTSFKKEHPDAVREFAVPSLLCGFASHHAGCLPLWKAFTEELFQKGLIKVVFATETLAAGINMPARSTVLSSLSKRGDTGHSLLSSNAMLQMAGRAGRRGLDEHGHVVLVQTAFEGAEEGCKLLFAGPDPLVSQFTASYGMVLNLLSSMKSPDGKVLRQGRTLEEARALVEKSFGNYIGNEVKVDANKEILKLEGRIAQLQAEKIPDVRELLTNEEIEEYMNLKQKLKAEKDHMKGLRNEFEKKKLAFVQPLLGEALRKQDVLPYVCICYHDSRTGNETSLSAVCVSVLLTAPSSIQENLMDEMSEELDGAELASEDGMSKSEGTQSHQDVTYYVALGSDNCWYAFSATSVQSISKTGMANATLSLEECSVRDALSQRISECTDLWQMAGRSGKSSFTNVWTLKGSFDTSSWSQKVADESNKTDELQFPKELTEVVEIYTKQRRAVVRIKKEMKATKASKEYWKLVAITKLRDANIARVEKRRSKLVARVKQMQPTGWQEFLQVVKVLEQAGAISPQTHEMLTLGKVAASIRGENELWLALAISEPCLRPLTPAQLAAVCASLVTEGIKIRSSDSATSDIYQASSTVQETVRVLALKQHWLLQLQAEHDVTISCDLDDQLAGLVEAWTFGVTWKELMTDCNMDEGDLAKLLRRTIDLLAQIPLLPNVNTSLRNAATTAADLMERSPISELIA